MDPIIRKMLTPGPAEIIRASQKDSEFISKLNSEVEGVIQSFFGQRASHKWQKNCVTLTSLLYHSLTNLTGHQTLGEEYCGILQVDELGSQTPGVMRTGSMILCTTFGYSTVKFILKLLEQYLSSLKMQSVGDNNEGACNVGIGDAKLMQESKNKQQPFREILINSLQIFKHFVPFLEQFHLALFYLQGTFYHFSKRFLGIHYLLVRRSLVSHDESSRRTLKYLMVISLINSFLACVNCSANFVKSNKAKQDENGSLNASIDRDKRSSSPSTEIEIDISRRCTLCLDQRINSSLTPCGHLFCWDCIIDWLRSKQDCPICREQLSTSRVVPLQNYN